MNCRMNSKEVRSSLFANQRNGFRRRGDEEQLEEHYEKENDDELELLGQQVSAVRHVAIEINEEVHRHNLLLSNMGNQFDAASSSLKGTMGRMQAMMQHGGSKHICVLILFVFCVFLALYWLMRSKR
eukprot:NODE_7431_length_476_cov_71.552693_g6987_i0.p1 GENE.NODE_7431_length_476_cov_71.552693_g6987_i0~~NODE_7431_length_476_cov_71.552693_g6987_i0.p1  ORF type:complete len:127 (+),score=23.31 NODE_7431_length_476_cov_71.552693_g6987_i0:88-468(+)